MTEDSLTGLSLREAEKKKKKSGQKERAVVFTAAPGRSGAEHAEDAQARQPYVVLDRDGELVCALFRTPDPSKERSRDE